MLALVLLMCSLLPLREEAWKVVNLHEYKPNNYPLIDANGMQPLMARFLRCDKEGPCSEKSQSHPYAAELLLDRRAVAALKLRVDKQLKVWTLPGESPEHALFRVLKSPPTH